MRFPSFFIIGASKAGTTSIFNTLLKHPDICLSQKKEPNFFNQFDISVEEIPNDKLFEYQKLFQCHNPNQIMGEASVAYLKSANANYWIKKYIPSAKILIILRNPLQRIISLYEMYTRLGIMQMNQDEAFAVTSYLTTQCLLYEDILSYINRFSRKQVLIMIFDDFLKNQGRAFSELCQFIGVPKLPTMILETKNKGGVPKSESLKLLTNRTLIETVKKITPSSKHIQMDYFIKTAFFKKIILQPCQTEELKKFFYEDVEKISNLIDRDLCQEWHFIDCSSA